MSKYSFVFRLAIQQVFEYRFDFFASMFKYALMVLMMSFIWLAVGKATSESVMSTSETVQYFFWGAVLYSLSNFHTNYIEEDIRYGHLTKYLLKPISPFWNYFFFELAAASLETIIKTAIFVPLLFILGFEISITSTTVSLLILYLPLIFFFSFNLFSLISSLAFWIQEAYALRWAFTIIIRFLAGLLVPLAFFPQLWQDISKFLPFQHLAYTPIMIINNQLSVSQSLQGLSILIFWTVVLYVLRKFVWWKGQKEYQGTGI